MIKIPAFEKFMLPIVKVLKQLGGSATIQEIYIKVAELMSFSQDQLNFPHTTDPNSSDRRTEVEYRLAWARTYLKKAGILENSQRGVWSLTKVGQSLETIDEEKIKRVVRQENKIEQVSIPYTQSELPTEIDNNPQNWRTQVINCLMEMTPGAFERLAQRLLRESGFTQVEVTGRSGDGGIDGTGIMRLNGFMSFHIIFQCKRYKGSVTPNQVREFRGSMSGRTDKGLLITTGTFTRDAIKEATREGVATIDLISGEDLIDKLKELSLGVKTRIVQIEEMEVEPEWFRAL